MSRVAGLVAGAVVVGVLAAGCGVPTGTDVRVDGPPPEAGRAGSGGDAEPPPGPDAARDEEELVGLFLQAAANDPIEAEEYLREFIHSDDRDGWQPEARVYVVRAEEPVVTRGDPVRVDVTVRRVGELAGNGVVDPLVNQEEELSFFVTTEIGSRDDDDEVAAGPGDRRLRLREPPAVILLDDRALESYFDPRPVYFWDSDGEKLVPDLRWLPRTRTEAQRSQTMVEWLIDGPSSWLSGSVQSLPDGVARDGNVVSDAGRLEIGLTAPHGEVDDRDLDAQLWWTLRPDLAAGDLEVVLLIDGAERQLGGGYRSSNPAVLDPPASFAVLDGVIHQHVPAEEVAPAALGDGLNEGIARAAVSRTGRYAALVREDEAAGELRLTVVGPDGVTETDLVAGSMGRPVWLNNPSGTGLIAVSGDLYQFTAGVDGEAKVEPVELPDLAGPVTAVAAAPDGRRLALIAGDRLYLASVSRAGGVVSSVGRRLPLPTTAGHLDGVAFLREDWLAVVGTADGQSRLYEVTVDGALERELPNGSLGTPDDIGGFVAHPGDPLDRADRGAIMYEAEGLTYRYGYQLPVATIDAVDLLGEAEPSPDAELPAPRAPFFLD